MRQSPLALLSFGLSLVRGVFAGYGQPCCQRDLPDDISANLLPRMPGPLPRREPRVHLPVSSSEFIGLPQLLIRSASRIIPLNDFLAGPLFEAADIPLCSGLPVCSPSRSFPPLPYYRQGSQGFYVRAGHASLPSHASVCLPSEYRQLMARGLPPRKIRSFVGCS
jgi:hypothetical protein